MIRLIAIAGGVLFALGISLGAMAAVFMQHDPLAYLVIAVASVVAAVGATAALMGAKSIIKGTA